MTLLANVSHGSSSSARMKKRQLVCLLLYVHSKRCLFSRRPRNSRFVRESVLERPGSCRVTHSFFRENSIDVFSRGGGECDRLPHHISSTHPYL